MTGGHKKETAAIGFALLQMRIGVNHPTDKGATAREGNRKRALPGGSHPSKMRVVPRRESASKRQLEQAFLLLTQQAGEQIGRRLFPRFGLRDVLPCHAWSAVSRVFLRDCLVREVGDFGDR